MRRKSGHAAVDRAVIKLGGPVATADFLGVRYQTVNNWRKKGYIADLAYAHRLARATGIDISEFVNDLESARDFGRK
jgi:hypothetical protein